MSVFDASFWRERIRIAEQKHHAVYKCTSETWARIEAKHCEILRELIDPEASVLDCGCAWGRLVDMMPWHVGDYVGVDLSPEFIADARARHPKKRFELADLRNLSALGEYDWAVFISIRPMVIRCMGREEWSKIEAEARIHAKKLLFLEYDDKGGGSIE